MKKIGVLFGQERTFPQAFVERINSKKIDGIIAEPVKNFSGNARRPNRLCSNI